MAIELMNKKLRKKNPKFFSKKNKTKIYFFGFFPSNHEKQNHELEGTMNCEITKCGDPLYNF